MYMYESKTGVEELLAVYLKDKSIVPLKSLYIFIKLKHKAETEINVNKFLNFLSAR